MAALNALESDLGFDSDYEQDLGSNSNWELDKGKYIVNAEPEATVATTKIHPNELEELE